MLCHENQWNAQSLSQKFDVTIEFSYEIFPAPLFVSFGRGLSTWSVAIEMMLQFVACIVRRKFLNWRFAKLIATGK